MIFFAVDTGSFPSNLKNADITPLFKKIECLLKSNYIPVRILPTLSKIYEKILCTQIYEYSNNIFSKYLSGFRNDHRSKHCLLFMLEILKKALDKGNCSGILLTDLSKTFNCISHQLLIAKLNAFDFQKKSFSLIYNLTTLV